MGGGSVGGGNGPYDKGPLPADRYPDRNRYPDEERYPPPRDRYTPYRPMDRYPAISDNSISGDNHGRPYDDLDYRPYGPSAGRYPDDRYASRYPASRYPSPPIREPIGGYTGRDAPESIFPDRRYRPSTYDSRYPGSSRIIPSSRYPNDDLVHNARRPEPDSAKRYPPAPLLPGLGPNKYPSSPNRFPVGNDRYPVDIYKYGNRYGGASAAGANIRPGKLLIRLICV